MDTAKLTQMFNRMVVRNKRSVNTLITYGDGVTSVMLHPHQQGAISTKGLTQIPDPKQVTLIDPTMAELVDLGILRAGDDVA